MKKITLVLFCLFTFSGFSQTPLETIKKYVNNNLSKIGMQSQDVSDLVIVNELSSESTGITNYHVKQRYSGIEVYDSDSNFWIKNGEVINKGGEKFIKNLASKINITTPKINVEKGLLEALKQLDENSFEVQILESNNNEYKLSNGILTDDPIKVKLVYFLTDDNQLKLVWSYEFYSQDTKHLWSLKVDAVNGKIIDKQDLVISCNFAPDIDKKEYVSKNEKLFYQTFFKEENQTVMNPGNTQYRVIPWNYESPNHSPRQLISNPEYVANASPNGWHNANSLTGATASLRYSITRGNNVWARNDFAGTSSTTSPNGTSPTGTGTFPNLTFDFPYAGTSDVASNYIDAANTNLFYMNNIMHDLWYQYGFNEANKNFQVNNYGRGGVQGDAVIAESQDGSQATSPNLNNSNFSTPSDGSAPRMQMYLWDVGPPFFIINSPAEIAGGKVSRDSSFNPGHIDIPQSPDGITADLVLYNDGVGDTSDACEPAINSAALNGKIAVIRRSTCTFVSKVLAAQQAGAIAAIVVNNVVGTVGMAGADSSIFIPAISVTQEVGEEIIAKMATQTVNATLQKSSDFLNSDGDFDNGVISHEYGHGISTRLSGNCLGGSEQQGEGWSDWFWLIMQIKPGDTRNDARGIGTFVMNQPTNGTGIREFKYSTDMSVDPHTFGDTNDMWYTDPTTNTQAVDVHGVGSVWAVMLWDLAWDYIDKYGYDPNIYTGTGGNNKVMRLVLDAIKLDGCNPTFVTARDAILAADLASTGGANYCLIWHAFARRGLGVGASSGTNTGVAGIKDQVESFVEPIPGSTPATGSACTLGATYFDNNDMLRIYPNPTNGFINVRINNYVGKVNFRIVDINGRIVSEFKNQDFNVEKTLDLNNLQSGVYVLKINGDNVNFTEKIIKN
ncbi:MAG TPA: T9SS-dependent M36 family metallopeptidase [Flavobacterium sp.]|uniref:T9SS-dependent M36 family metallopeptidase n=1 Tax=Flavobacterium sp. TaxID=239 RepID=UPI002B974B4A|nr:T9SS-dependent M36 family metallopeptidase [Flavobacterium sp.]HNP31704.1 T9SS-dependent M36 family metallopeptidase [Flavobacterium sp.]